MQGCKVDDSVYVGFGVDWVLCGYVMEWGVFFRSRSVLCVLSLLQLIWFVCGIGG